MPRGKKTHSEQVAESPENVNQGKEIAKKRGRQKTVEVVPPPAHLIDWNALAKEFFDCRESKKVLEKREEELKAIFKEEVPSGTKFFGPVCITSSTYQQSRLDKDALIAAFGEEKVKSCEKISECFKIEVRCETSAPEATKAC